MGGEQTLESALALLSNAPGTYALGLSLLQPTQCTVGALGPCEFPAGLYLYIGSAWGPGGLRARVGRHVRGGSARRWHIDYLRAHCEPVALWVAVDQRLECVWARLLWQAGLAVTEAPHFGASDCACPTHLFRLEPPGTGDLTLPDAHALRI